MSTTVTKEKLITRVGEPVEDATKLRPFYRGKMLRKARKTTALLMKEGFIPPAPED